MARKDAQLNLRIPEDVKDELTQTATKNARSITAEAVARIKDAAPLNVSLRDYFAAKALEPATPMGWRNLEYTPQDGLSIIENNARLAYQIADAMLAARSR